MPHNPAIERRGGRLPGTFGVKGTHFAAATNRRHNRVMKIVIELNQAQTERLQTIAASLGVDAQELAQAAVADLVSTSADDFEAAASRVLNKNRELYQRLAVRSGLRPTPAGYAER